MPKTAQKKGLDYTFVLGSSEMVNTPGLLAWAMNVYKSPSKKDREVAVDCIANSYNLPRYIARGLVSGELPYEVDGEKVIVNIKIEIPS